MPSPGQYVHATACAYDRTEIEESSRRGLGSRGFVAAIICASDQSRFYWGVAMYKRILVAIDGSVTSDLALPEAIGLEKDQNAMLRLVHVVDVTPPAYMTTETASAIAVHFPLAEYQKALQEAGEKLLTTRATTAREAGVNVDTKLIAVGMLGERIYEAIEEQSKQWPANLVVVGTEGRRGFQRLMIGSVAEGLVRISTKPVLLIRGT
jgi:nucleotide-binding universal stress UspA family protein